MKTFKDLSGDIYNVLDVEKEHLELGDTQGVAETIAEHLSKATEVRDKTREIGKLWASDLGKPCLRQHWFNFNRPELGERLTGNTRFKFLYGNILEEVVLHYAKEAGHEVSHEQERIEVGISGWQVSGRIDAVIDGVLADVKSTSSFGYTRYKDGINHDNDSFGYLWQLGFYRHYGPFEVEDSGFVLIDKQNGHIAAISCEGELPSKADIERRVQDISEACSRGDYKEVGRGYNPEPYGKSGNYCLPTSCSYCAFKFECHSDANRGRGLRVFAYNHKPVFFTEVKREPRVMEITHEHT